MDAFEQLVATLLTAEGWWVRQSVKVCLTREEKIAIGRPSAPRWEIDLIAYKASTNQLLAVECKSYLDSRGVDPTDFEGGAAADRYKLFTQPRTREVVLGRLKNDLVAGGLVLANTDIRLALATGRVARDPDRLAAIFTRNGWLLFDPEWISSRVSKLSEGAYENSVASLVAKFILRQPPARRTRKSSPPT